jgi:hypothetical protein
VTQTLRREILPWHFSFDSRSVNVRYLFQSNGVPLTYFVVLNDKNLAYGVIMFACQGHRTPPSKINLRLFENFAISKATLFPHRAIRINANSCHVHFILSIIQTIEQLDITVTICTYVRYVLVSNLYPSTG